jgi:hypothetical protein
MKPRLRKAVLQASSSGGAAQQSFLPGKAAEMAKTTTETETATGRSLDTAVNTQTEALLFIADAPFKNLLQFGALANVLKRVPLFPHQCYPELMCLSKGFRRTLTIITIIPGG